MNSDRKKYSVFFTEKGNLVCLSKEDANFKPMFNDDTINLLNEVVKKHAISNCKINEENDNAMLYFKSAKAIIEIHDLERIADTYGISAIQPLINAIALFLNNKEERQKNISPKVTRKNKYSHAKISKNSLIVLVILGLISSLVISLSALVKNKSSSSTTISEETVKQMVENPTDDISKYIPDNIIIPEENPSVDDYVEEFNNDNIAYFDFYDNTNSKKAIDCKNNYYDLICKYSNTYGVDPNLVLAIATQERGYHSEIKDKGGATGLMQLAGFWVGEELKAYNFDTNQYDTIKITKENIGDLDTNIKAAIFIMRDNYRYMNQNLLLTACCYNAGCGAMWKLVEKYAADNNLTKNEVYANQTDTGWISLYYTADFDDPYYLENVFQYMKQGTTIKFRNEDGTVTSVKVDSTRNRENDEIKR